MPPGLASIKSVLSGKTKVLDATLRAKVIEVSTDVAPEPDGKRIKIDYNEFAVIADKTAYCLVRCIYAEKQGYLKSGDVLIIEKFVIQDQMMVLNRQSKVSYSGRKCETIGNIPSLADVLDAVMVSAPHLQEASGSGKKSPGGTIEQALKVRNYAEGKTIKCWVIDASQKRFNTARNKAGKREKWLQTVCVEDETGRAALSIWGKNNAEPEQGRKYEISFVFSSVFKGEVRLQTSWDTTFTPIDTAETCPFAQVAIPSAIDVNQTVEITLLSFAQKSQVYAGCPTDGCFVRKLGGSAENEWKCSKCAFGENSDAEPLQGARLLAVCIVPGLEETQEYVMFSNAVQQIMKEFPEAYDSDFSVNKVTDALDLPLTIKAQINLDGDVIKSAEIVK